MYIHIHICQYVYVNGMLCTNLFTYLFVNNYLLLPKIVAVINFYSSTWNTFLEALDIFFDIIYRRVLHTHTLDYKIDISWNRYLIIF